MDPPLLPVLKRNSNLNQGVEAFACLDGVSIGKAEITSNTLPTSCALLSSTRAVRNGIRFASEGACIYLHRKRGPFSGGASVRNEEGGEVKPVVGAPIGNEACARWIATIYTTIYKVPLQDVVGVESQGCRKSKRGDGVRQRKKKRIQSPATAQATQQSNTDQPKRVVSFFYYL